jgi:hypothetical protein
LEWEAEAARAVAVERQRRLHALAWLTATLTRSKKLPDFARFTDVDPKPKAQTWQDMKATLMALTGAHGEGGRRTRRTS